MAMEPSLSFHAYETISLNPDKYGWVQVTAPLLISDSKAVCKGASKSTTTAFECTGVQGVSEQRGAMVYWSSKGGLVTMKHCNTKLPGRVIYAFCAGPQRTGIFYHKDSKHPLGLLVIEHGSNPFHTSSAQVRKFESEFLQVLEDVPSEVEEGKPTDGSKHWDSDFFTIQSASLSDTDVGLVLMVLITTSATSHQARNRKDIIPSHQASLEGNAYCITAALDHPTSWQRWSWEASRLPFTQCVVAPHGRTAHLFTVGVHPPRKRTPTKDPHTVLSPALLEGRSQTRSFPLREEGQRDVGANDYLIFFTNEVENAFSHMQRVPVDVDDEEVKWKETLEKAEKSLPQSSPENPARSDVPLCFSVQETILSLLSSSPSSFSSSSFSIQERSGSPKVRHRFYESETVWVNGQEYWTSPQRSLRVKLDEESLLLTALFQLAQQTFMVHFTFSTGAATSSGGSGNTTLTDLKGFEGGSKEWRGQRIHSSCRHLPGLSTEVASFVILRNLALHHRPHRTAVSLILSTDLQLFACEVFGRAWKVQLDRPLDSLPTSVLQPRKKDKAPNEAAVEKHRHGSLNYLQLTALPNGEVLFSNGGMAHFLCVSNSILPQPTRKEAMAPPRVLQYPPMALLQETTLEEQSGASSTAMTYATVLGKALEQLQRWLQTPSATKEDIFTVFATQWLPQLRFYGGEIAQEMQLIHRFYRCALEVAPPKSEDEWNEYWELTRFVEQVIARRNKDASVQYMDYFYFYLAELYTQSSFSTREGVSLVQEALTHIISYERRVSMMFHPAPSVGVSPLMEYVFGAITSGVVPYTRIAVELVEQLAMVSINRERGSCVGFASKQSAPILHAMGFVLLSSCLDVPLYLILGRQVHHNSSRTTSGSADGGSTLENHSLSIWCSPSSPLHSSLEISCSLHAPVQVFESQEDFNHALALAGDLLAIAPTNSYRVVEGMILATYLTPRYHCTTALFDLLKPVWSDAIARASPLHSNKEWFEECAYTATLSHEEALHRIFTTVDGRHSIFPTLCGVLLTSSHRRIHQKEEEHEDGNGTRGDLDVTLYKALEQSIPADALSGCVIVLLFVMTERMIAAQNNYAAAVMKYLQSQSTRCTAYGFAVEAEKEAAIVLLLEARLNAAVKRTRRFWVYIHQLLPYKIHTISDSYVASVIMSSAATSSLGDKSASSEERGNAVRADHVVASHSLDPSCTGTMWTRVVVFCFRLFTFVSFNVEVLQYMYHATEQFKMEAAGRTDSSKGNRTEAHTEMKGEDGCFLSLAASHSPEERCLSSLRYLFLTDSTVIPKEWYQYRLLQVVTHAAAAAPAVVSLAPTREGTFSAPPFSFPLASSSFHSRTAAHREWNLFLLRVLDASGIATHCSMAHIKKLFFDVSDAVRQASSLSHDAWKRGLTSSGASCKLPRTRTPTASTAEVVFSFPQKEEVHNDTPEKEEEAEAEEAEEEEAILWQERMQKCGRMAEALSVTQSSHRYHDAQTHFLFSPLRDASFPQWTFQHHRPERRYVMDVEWIQHLWALERDVTLLSSVATALATQIMHESDVLQWEEEKKRRGKRGMRKGGHRPTAFPPSLPTAGNRTVGAGKEGEQGGVGATPTFLSTSFSSSLSSSGSTTSSYRSGVSWYSFRRREMVGTALGRPLFGTVMETLSPAGAVMVTPMTSSEMHRDTALAPPTPVQEEEAWRPDGNGGSERRSAESARSTPWRRRPPSLLPSTSPDVMAAVLSSTPHASPSRPTSTVPAPLWSSDRTPSPTADSLSPCLSGRASGVAPARHSTLSATGSGTASTPFSSAPHSRSLSAGSGEKRTGRTAEWGTTTPPPPSPPSPSASASSPTRATDGKAFSLLPYLPSNDDGRNRDHTPLTSARSIGGRPLQAWTDTASGPAHDHRGMSSSCETEAHQKGTSPSPFSASPTGCRGGSPGEAHRPASRGHETKKEDAREGEAETKGGKERDGLWDQFSRSPYVWEGDAVAWWERKRTASRRPSDADGRAVSDRHAWGERKKRRKEKEEEEEVVEETEREGDGRRHSCPLPASTPLTRRLPPFLPHDEAAAVGPHGAARVGNRFGSWKGGRTRREMGKDDDPRREKGAWSHRHPRLEGAAAWRETSHGPPRRPPWPSREERRRRRRQQRWPTCPLRGCGTCGLPRATWCTCCRACRPHGRLPHPPASDAWYLSSCSTCHRDLTRTSPHTLWRDEEGEEEDGAFASRAPRRHRPPRAVRMSCPVLPSPTGRECHANAFALADLPSTQGGADALPCPSLAPLRSPPSSPGYPTPLSASEEEDRIAFEMVSQEAIERTTEARRRDGRERRPPPHDPPPPYRHGMARGKEGNGPPWRDERGRPAAEAKRLLSAPPHVPIPDHHRMGKAMAAGDHEESFADLPFPPPPLLSLHTSLTTALQRRTNTTTIPMRRCVPHEDRDAMESGGGGQARAASPLAKEMPVSSILHPMTYGEAPYPSRPSAAEGNVKEKEEKEEERGRAAPVAAEALLSPLPPPLLQLRPSSSIADVQMGGGEETAQVTRALWSQWQPHVKDADFTVAPAPAAVTTTTTTTTTTATTTTTPERHGGEEEAAEDVPSPWMPPLLHLLHPLSPSPAFPPGGSGADGLAGQPALSVEREVGGGGGPSPLSSTACASPPSSSDEPRKSAAGAVAGGETPHSSPRPSPLLSLPSPSLPVFSPPAVTAVVSDGKSIEQDVPASLRVVGGGGDPIAETTVPHASPPPLLPTASPSLPSWSHDASERSATAPLPSPVVWTPAQQEAFLTYVKGLLMQGAGSTAGGRDGERPCGAGVPSGNGGTSLFSCPGMCPAMCAAQQQFLQSTQQQWQEQVKTSEAHMARWDDLLRTRLESAVPQSHASLSAAAVPLPPPPPPLPSCSTVPPTSRDETAAGAGVPPAASLPSPSFPSSTVAHPSSASPLSVPAAAALPSVSVTAPLSGTPPAVCLSPAPDITPVPLPVATSPTAALSSSTALVEDRVRDALRDRVRTLHDSTTAAALLTLNMEALEKEIAAVRSHYASAVQSTTSNAPSPLLPPNAASEGASSLADTTTTLPCPAGVGTCPSPLLSSSLSPAASATTTPIARPETDPLRPADHGSAPPIPRTSAPASSSSRSQKKKKTSTTTTKASLPRAGRPSVVSSSSRFPFSSSTHTHATSYPTMRHDKGKAGATSRGATSSVEAPRTLHELYRMTAMAHASRPKHPTPAGRAPRVQEGVYPLRRTTSARTSHPSPRGSERTPRASYGVPNRGSTPARRTTASLPQKKYLPAAGPSRKIPHPRVARVVGSEPYATAPSYPSKGMLAPAVGNDKRRRAENDRAPSKSVGFQDEGEEEEVWYIPSSTGVSGVQPFATISNASFAPPTQETNNAQQRRRQIMQRVALLSNEFK